jgi:C4-dicarboxylate-specific signal transduction histidine kinase
MATKKLKTAPHTMLIPEGLYALPTPVLLWQKNTGTLWANPYFEKEFGIALTARFGAPSHLHLVRDLIRERPVSLELFAMIGRHEGFILETVQGKKVPVELKVTAYGDASEECFLVLVEDVSVKLDLEKQLLQNHFEIQKAYTDLKTTQSALVQTAKLASLGELSSGIAHELNQPLQAIMGFSQELEHLENLSPTGKEFIGDIIHASRKMAEIIRSIRSFARTAENEFTDTAVDHAMKEAVKLMNHQLMQKNITVELTCDESLPLIQANSIQLEQVFINLLSNARDAIESVRARGGKIGIHVGKGKSSATREAAVIITLTDNGCGMSDETKTKIFDPFFTTKEVGKGTGLGMSISYGILQQLSAQIEVKSKVGEGSEFTLTLPVAAIQKNKKSKAS